MTGENNMKEIIRIVIIGCTLIYFIHKTDVLRKGIKNGNVNVYKTEYLCTKK